MVIVNRGWLWFKRYVRTTLRKLRKVGSWFKEYKNIRKFIFWVIVVFLSILLFWMLGAMVSVMLYPDIKSTLMDLTGINTKPELLKFIGLGMSGIIATLGVVGLLQRATALNEQNEISEKGHVHERFKAATEHLGSERTSVRIAAFYEFYRLAKIESEPDLQKTIFGILCAHLRQTTTHKNYQTDIIESEEIKPTEEIQSLLDILFKPHKDKLIFSGLVANLEGVNVQGANLQRANLKRAILRKVNLEKANMWNINLQEAYLWKANLQRVSLEYANIQKAHLCMADLRRANLQTASLQMANLQGASLQRANLQGANLQGANLNIASIEEYTTMPDGWKDMVQKHEKGETGVRLVDDNGKFIKNL